MSGSLSSSGGTPPGGPATRVIDILEAEQAVLFGGAAAESEVSGYSGEGYVPLAPVDRDDPFAEESPEPEAITFTIEVPEDGWYTLNFRYSNGTNEDGYRNLLVDGEDIPGAIRFDNRFADTAWATAHDRMPLAAGTHEVTLTADMGEEVVGLGAGRAEILVDQLEVVAGVSPSDQTSARALMVNNGENMVAIHESAETFATDTSNFGPFLAQLRHGANWEQDQIDFGTSWFQWQDEDGTRRNYAPNFESTLYLDSDGIMNVEYGSFLPTGEALPVAISREYAMVPGEPLLVERWTFENQREISEPDITWSFANTLGLPEELAQRAVWDEGREVFLVELGQGEDQAPLYLAFGAYQEMQSQNVALRGEGDELDQSFGRRDGYDPADRSSDGVLAEFQEEGSLGGATRAEGEGLALAMAREDIALRAGRPNEFYFFYTMADSIEALNEQVDTALNPQGSAAPGSPSYWFQETEEAWAERLEGAKALPLVTDGEAGSEGDGTTGDGLRPIGDPALEEAYKASLVAILQSQQPEFGSFVAATSPAYDYKVWPRDSAVTAWTLDAAGLHDDAEAYWNWMASIVEDGSSDNPTFERGTFHTNYSFWEANESIPFVEPEWDAQGLFLMGAARHALELREAGRGDQAEAFLADETMRDAIVWSAEFIRGSIDETGFGAPDFSIWEEIYLYNGYTQVTYAAGLQSAALIADEIGRPDLAEGWREGAATIVEAITRPVDDPDYPGLWDEEAGHFIWGIEPETGEPVLKGNAAIDLLFVTGLLDPESEQGSSQIDWIIENLGKNDYGISRYEGDLFYASSTYSPGGTYESRQNEAAWPQMTAYVGIAQEQAGNLDWAYDSLNWQVSRYGQEFMPPGEGVDWSTREPLPSTQVEPVTGAWYIQNLLNYTGQFDPRVPQDETLVA